MRARVFLLTFLLLSAVACSDDDVGLLPDGFVAADAGVADSLLPDLLTPDAAPPKPLKWGACSLANWPTGYPKPGSGVQCATMDVPRDHNKPAGASFKIRLARDRADKTAKGAIFHLAGGPGGASVTQSGTIPYYFGALGSDHDMIYVDQRGTGGSGYLDCSKGYPNSKAEWVACAAEHKGKDLGVYSTLAAAHDLDLVRRRLGYKKIYLRGGSYGTRLGLEYVRQYGARVSGAVLDGLAPPDWDYFAQAAGALDLGLKWLVADCKASAACTKVSPTLGPDLAARRATLKKTPRKILLDGSPYVETEGTYLQLLYALIDRQSTRYKVPAAIHQAVKGDHTAWNKLFSSATGYTVTDAASDPAPGAPALMPAPPARVRGPAPEHRGTSYVAPGLFFSVVCSEWLPNAGGLAKLKKHEATLTWGDGRMVGMAEACASWGGKPLDQKLRKAVSSSTPVLLLSGGIDLRTPPALGLHAAKTLSKSSHVVIPYWGHSTISNTCAVSIITAFVQAGGKLSGLDTSCTKSQTAPAW